MENLDLEHDFVTIMNPQTCGIYKNGSDRYIVDANGQRTEEIDNELLKQATLYQVSGGKGFVDVPIQTTYQRDVLVPRYYDKTLEQPFDLLKKEHGFDSITIGELCDAGLISVIGGHGSPSNDLRNGSIPYVKVSDIRNMRININPTNLISLELAKKFWKTKTGKSNLQAWDLISPSRASSNIGEFAMLVPGEEQIVLTKEVFIIRVQENDIGYSPFYLLWALSLKEVRMQWKRVTLMQTNREDVGTRYREVRIPKPISPAWAEGVSKAFREYFIGLAEAKKQFVFATSSDDYEYIASVSAFDSEEIQ